MSRDFQNLRQGPCRAAERTGLPVSGNHLLGETVLNIGPRVDGVFTLETDKGKHYSRAIVITVGMGAFTPKKLDIEGLEAYEKGSSLFRPEAE